MRHDDLTGPGQAEVVRPDQATLHDWLRLRLFLGEEPTLDKDTWIDWYPDRPQALKMCSAYVALFTANGFTRFGVRPPRRAPRGGWDIIIGPLKAGQRQAGRADEVHHASRPPRRRVA